MIALRYTIGLFLVACVTALPVEDLTKLSIVKDVKYVKQAVHVAASFQSNSSEVINEFSVSRGRVTSGTLSCRGICKGTMSYDITINGVSSEYLDSKDRIFREALNSNQIAMYDSAKSSYGGGLNVPFLRGVGINLGGSYSQEQVDEASQRLENYDSLADAARNIMESFDMVSVRVWGRLEVTSYTSIESVATAYVKFAKVTLLDGSELRVVSSSGADVSAVDNRGTELPVENWEGGADQKSDGDNFFF